MITKGIVLRIIVPSDFLKRHPFGGTSGFVENIAGKLGIQKKIFGIAVGNTIPWQEYKISPMKSFIPVAHFSHPSYVPMRFKCLIGYWRYRRRILESGVDVLYIHNPELALPFLYGSMRLPVIFHQHGSSNPVEKATYIWGRSFIFKRLYDFILWKVHRRSDWTIVIDQLSLKQANCHGIGHKTSLIMNAVDTSSFYPDNKARRALRDKFKINDDEKIIMFVGRLEEVKRVDRVIERMRQLNLRGTKRYYRLFIVGDGSLRNNLVSLENKKELSGMVIFLGHIPHDKLLDYYNMADVVVLPSDTFLSG